MILTLTPNPSVDLLFDAARLLWDDANRIGMPRRRAGGQGINVARAARVLGGEAAAVAPLGGAAGAELTSMLAAEGLPLHAVAIEGETRVFVGAREHVSGRSLLLNPRGPELRPSEVDALRRAVEAELGRAVAATRSGWPPPWLLCCGSLPPGAPDALYADLGREARRVGARFVPDCDGAPLRLAAEGGCDLLVPNRHEAERLLGRAIGDPLDAGLGAAELLDFGPATAAITLGADGAVLATADGAWHAAAAAPAGSGSAVGAGDAFLAALLLGVDASEEPGDALRSAVAAGSAVLRATGPDLLTKDDYREVREAVRVTKLDL